MTAPRGLWKTFLWPLVIAIASLCGLLSALIGDGSWDAASWLLLGIPLAVGLYLSQRRDADPVDRPRAVESE